MKLKRHVNPEKKQVGAKLVAGAVLVALLVLITAMVLPVGGTEPEPEPIPHSLLADQGPKDRPGVLASLDGIDLESTRLLSSTKRFDVFGARDLNDGVCVIVVLSTDRGPFASGSCVDRRVFGKQGPYVIGQTESEFGGAVLVPDEGSASLNGEPVPVVNNVAILPDSVQHADLELEVVLSDGSRHRLTIAAVSSASG